VAELVAGGGPAVAVAEGAAVTGAGVALPVGDAPERAVESNAAVPDEVQPVSIAATRTATARATPRADHRICLTRAFVGFLTGVLPLWSPGS
jgi:hypothetical protein